MLFRHLFHCLNSSGPRRPVQQSQRRQPATCRLSVEVLEVRVVPAALSVGDAVVVEYPGMTQIAAVRVSLDAPSGKTVSVNYATTNGTATAGSDYTAAAGTLNFAPSETSKTIIIGVPGDDQREGTETFFLNLKGAKNAKIADGQGVVTIMDDRPAVRISNAEAYPGATLMTFTVSLSAAYDQAVTVNYATADVTALAGQDYVATAGTLTFAPGETSKTITVEVLGDHTTDPISKEFRVNLSVAYPDRLVVNTWGYGIIWNNDAYGDGYGAGGGYYDGGY
jgi:hypothetical protein